MTPAPKRRWFQYSLRTILFLLAPYAAIVAWTWTLNCDLACKIAPTVVLTAALFVASFAGKWAMNGAFLAVFISCVTGAAAWIVDPQQHTLFHLLFLAPGIYFAFGCLGGDTYHDAHEMLHDAIPAAIVINMVAGLFLGGIGRLVFKLSRKKTRLD